MENQAGQETANPEPMRIAYSRYDGHWTTEDWKAIDFSTEEGWQKGIDIFEDRHNYRFISIMKDIKEINYAGFAMMALDCLLIETLQQFYKGVSETPWGQNENYFVDFLTETSFNKYFDKKKAKLFYKTIRCGILHQAETKESARIWVREGEPLVQYSEDRKGLVVNRRLFHEQLEKEFNDYVFRLRKNDPPDPELRNNLKNKMDAICRV